MASSTALKDLTQNFFQCSVCLEQLKEPKLLPCLHRFCSDCLKTVIQKRNCGTIDCPICRQRCPVTENGVQGFKTDFHMKNILEFIQLQTSYEKKQLKKCVSCSKEISAFAYCFQCRNFLCSECYNVHISSEMFSDHQRHIVRLDNIEGKKLTLEKLSKLTKDPRCHDHENKEAHLCCVTCENVPICMACIYNKHKGHDLHDVTEQAEIERNQLKLKLAALDSFKRKMYELPKKTEASRKQLIDNVSRKTEILNNQYKKQADRTKAKIEESKVLRKEGVGDIESKRKNEESQINRNYEEELNELNKKYDKIRKTCTAKYDYKLDQFTENLDKIEGDFFSELESVDRNFKSLTTEKDLLMDQNMNDLQQISDYCDHIIRRYENLRVTALSILECKDDWTDVQCIPDVKTSCESLIEEMKKEFPEVESLSDIVIDDITKVIVDEVTISEHEESVVAVEGITNKGWFINGITSSINCNIVITGAAAENLSHITVINKKGEIQIQKQIERAKRYRGVPLSRSCCYLSEFEVVTACTPDEISIYDVHDGSLKVKYLSDVISGWPADRYVLCVATDDVNNHILVGTNSRYVYVLDDQLNYSHTITMPELIRMSSDITVHEVNLLVCDLISKIAYVVNVDGSDGTLIYTFIKPDLDGVDWRPISVCTDKNDFIYMLWSDGYFGGRRFLVQYSQNGRKALTRREVVLGTRSLTTVEENGLEKLVIATLELGKLHIYSLKLRIM